MTPIDPALPIAEIILKYLRNEVTPDEKLRLETWIASDSKNHDLFAELTNEELLKKELLFFNALSVDNAWQQVANQTIASQKLIPMPRKKRWLYAAAAAIIVLIGSIVTYQLRFKNDTNSPIATVENVKPNAQPGGNKAVLTLADGSQIILDNSVNGNITSQGNSDLIKSEGKLTYKTSGTGSEILYNTITVPRGGEYQLELADGSRVWLNSASSCTYPNSFPGKERKIEMTGEAYFEITKDDSKPFKINVDGKTEIEVLGTHFNINAYNNEATINTTLLEGKVKVTPLLNAGLSNSGSKLLSPGQQARQSADGKITLHNHPDLEEVVAWKNGLFKLNQADIPTVLRQLARWYDFDLEFAGAIPPGTISGTVPRNTTLQNVIEALQMSGIHFKVEGKKIIIK